MKANGLELKEIRSRVEYTEFKSPIRDFLSDIFREDGYIVAYLDYKVVMGYYRNGSITLPDNESIEEKYLQRLRLFNEKKELYLWRSNGNLKARFRIDEEGDDTSVVDAYQVLWGTLSEQLGDFTRLTEDRGTTLIVPVKGVEVNDMKSRLFLKTRNYIGYTPAHQATYIDCRFMGFIKGGI
ncbi:hypothetical protein JZK55_15080 [Dissulfurispira thermophila]|uniref:TIGR03984 family CRISPR-associated protein n=1 Tax=Dissulfurispira thermophila TaxID=2715679 RepID=A0A7G1H3R6_9BACT|nr:CRISPR-associated protein Csx19 [Dissulfurispira thermophila]BCB96586.1 hypothetical protein JZK55_15080 [Dissulfurispira thermophila]